MGIMAYSILWAMQDDYPLEAQILHSEGPFVPQHLATIGLLEQLGLGSGYALKSILRLRIQRGFNLIIRRLRG